MRANIKKYFKFNKGNHKYLNMKSYEYENGTYLLSNSYSIMKLNKAEDLEIQETNETLNGFIRNFEDNYEDWGKRLNKRIDLNKLNEYEKYVEKIIIERERSFGIDIEMFKTMYKIIKPTELRILQKWGFNSWNYVYELKNNKNGEVGYLLPILEF